MKRLFIMAATTLLLIACAGNGNKDTFTIKGTAQGLPDGEKLQVANSEGEPLDTIVVNGGKFTYQGKADSARLCNINVINDEFNSLLFITEPGTITVAITATPGQSVVAGTTANDALQKLVEETRPFYDEIHQIENIVYSDTVLSQDSEWQLASRYRDVYNSINKSIAEAAKANADNELGYLLLIHYIDKTENADLLRDIIGRMPQNFRLRKPIIDLEAALKANEATETGKQTPDFSLPMPSGDTISVMSEVRKNKFTILDFWASWCGPCRREMPSMKQLFADYHQKGLGIIGLSLDKSAADWNRAISDLKLEWPQMSDLAGWKSVPAQTFCVNSIPYTVVVDSMGIILQKGLRGEELRQFIEQLFSAQQ